MVKRSNELKETIWIIFSISKAHMSGRYEVQVDLIQTLGSKLQQSITDKTATLMLPETKIYQAQISTYQEYLFRARISGHS